MPQSRQEARIDAQAAIALPPDQRKLLLTETADLHLFDRATSMFMLQEKAVQANLWLVEGREFPCWLSVAGAGGELWVSTPVDNQMPLTFQEVRVWGQDHIHDSNFYWHESPSSQLFSIFYIRSCRKTSRGSFACRIRRPSVDSMLALLAVFLRPRMGGILGINSRCVFQLICVRTPIWQKAKVDTLQDEERRYSQESYIQDVEMATSDDEDEEHEDRVEHAEDSEGASPGYIFREDS